MKLHRKIFIVVMIILMLVQLCSCKQNIDDGNGVIDIVPGDVSYDDSNLSLNMASTHTYAVSTSNRLATQVGMAVLEHGGNAVDAAVAVAYTLAVVQPYASGLGGGGCMLLYDPNTNSYSFYDYFAAMRSTSNSSRNYIGVPGFVKGMQAVYNDYATKDLDELLSYSINYAENGFPVTADIETRISVAHADLRYYPMLHDNNGNPLKQGSTIYMKDLANTIKTIAKDGPDSFYTGKIANDIVSSSSTDITMEDMSSYNVQKRNPVISSFMGYEVCAAPAPFSGATVIQMLKMAEAINIDSPAVSAQKYFDDLYTITSKAYTSRYKYIADPEFIDVKEEDLVSSEYIGKLINQNSNNILDDDEHFSTTHFAIIDENGMVVSSTNTLSSFWGSRVCVDGVFLNDTMKHFSNNGNSINYVSPGKRPRSYSCPLIVKGNDGFILSIGTPGGNNIPKILAPVLLDYLKFGTDLQDAIFKGRVFSKSYDTLVVEEREFFPSIADADSSNYFLVKRDDAAYFGNIAAVGYSPKEGRVFSVYDDRRGGTSISANEN